MVSTCQQLCFAARNDRRAPLAFRSRFTYYDSVGLRDGRYAAEEILAVESVECLVLGLGLGGHQLSIRRTSVILVKVAGAFTEHITSKTQVISKKEPTTIWLWALSVEFEESLRLLLVVFRLIVLGWWRTVVLFIDNAHRLFGWSLVLSLPLFLGKGSNREDAQHRNYHQISD